MDKFTHILVGTDFSPASKAALEIGLKLARRDKALLTLAHVLSNADSRAIEREASSTAIDQQPVYVTRQRLEAALKEAGSEGVMTRSMVAQGVPTERMVALTHELDCDLVLVAPTGKGLVTKALLGSTAEALIRHSRVPVWISRPKASHQYKRLIVGLDYTSASNPALRAAATQARRLSMTMDVVHVSQNTGEAVVIPVESRGGIVLENVSKKRFEDFCRDRVPELLDKRIRVNYRHLYGSAVDQIIDHALKTNADLIVVGNHQRGMINEVFKGSTARHLLKHTPCCLLVTRDPVAQDHTKSPQSHTVATQTV